jgi:hypothetical protein
MIGMVVYLLQLYDMKHTIDWYRFLLLSSLLWILQATYATLNTGLFQTFSGSETRWMAISIYSFGTASVWLILSPLIMWVVMTIISKNYHLHNIILLHIIGAFVIAAIQRLITIYITYGLIKWTEAVDPQLLALENFFGMNYWRQVGNGIVIYFVIVGIIYAYIFYLKNQSIQLEQAQLETELSRIRLENLFYQLQPHFLFNSLQ